MRAMWAAQIPYIATCLVGVLAIFHVQHYRVIRGARWWLYNVLVAALCWEAIDAWQYGAPGWPASRWLLLPTLTATLVWTAISDWQQRRRGHAVVRWTVLQQGEGLDWRPIGGRVFASRDEAARVLAQTSPRSGCILARVVIPPGAPPPVR